MRVGQPSETKLGQFENSEWIVEKKRDPGVLLGQSECYLQGMGP